MEIVVEILEQGQRKPRLHRLDTDAFSVGRGWDADIIVQDDAIDAEHLWFELDEGNTGFEASDCETVNGSKRGKTLLTQDEPIDWGEWITLGQTKICLHKATDAVPEAKKHTPFDALISTLQSSWCALSLLILALLYAQYSAHMERALSFEWDQVINGAVQLLSALVLWSIVLGSITRLTKHEFQIWLHLSLASLALITNNLLGAASTVFAFNSLSTIWANWSSTLISVVIGLFWLMLTLYVGTNLSIKKRLGIATALLAFFLLTTQILPQMQKDNWVAVPSLVTVSKPSSWLFASESSKDEYLSNIENAFERVSDKALDQRDDSIPLD